LRNKAEILEKAKSLLEGAREDFIQNVHVVILEIASKMNPWWLGQ